MKEKEDFYEWIVVLKSGEEYVFYNSPTNPMKDDEFLEDSDKGDYYIMYLYEGDNSKYKMDKNDESYKIPKSDIKEIKKGKIHNAVVIGKSNIVDIIGEK